MYNTTYIYIHTYTCMYIYIYICISIYIRKDSPEIRKRQVKSPGTSPMVLRKHNSRRKGEHARMIMLPLMSQIGCHILGWGYIHVYIYI